MEYIYFNRRDTFEEYPNLNVSKGCTNQCVFCDRHTGSSFYYSHRLEINPGFKELMSEVRMLNLHAVKEFWITGLGEPLLRLDELVLDVIKELRRHAKVGLITNGHGSLIFPELDVPNELKKAGLNSIQVSLNAENAKKYLKLCRPILKYLKKSYIEVYDGVKQFIKDCKDAGLSAKASLVNIPNNKISNPKFLPDIDKCRKIADELGVPLKVIEYFGPNIKL